MTTVVIFFKCLLIELEDRVKKGEQIASTDGTEIELWRLSETYLKIHKRRKLKTVVYDDNFFEKVIIDYDNKVIADTRSKERIYEAKKYFSMVLNKNKSTSELLGWKEIIEKAVITTFEVSDKVQATQIFAFQNDRGKDLSNLEKLKAFLMYQIYMNSEDENERDAIGFIENEFSEIYKQTERINKLDEDQVLSHHNTAFIKGWDSPIDNIKKELRRESDKVQWIKDFCANLKNSFLNVEEIEKNASNDSFIGDILILDASNSWPLLLKIYHFHKNEIDKFEPFFRLMEITLFKMTFSYGDYRTNNFHSFAKEYNGNSDELKSSLEYCSKNGFKDYWNFDENFKSCLEGNYHYWSITRYLLWKYENYLREKSKDIRPMHSNEYLNDFGNKKWDNTIEHITPQKPDEVVYSEAFKNDYVNNLGNLVLMTLGKNAQLNNSMPIDKCERFLTSTLISQKRVGDTIKQEKKWEEDQILNRKKNH